MERRNGAALCPRLIDYLVLVVGQRPAPTAKKSTPIWTPPEIVRRYPVKDLKDFILPMDVSFFCQPGGCPHVTRQQLSQVPKNPYFIFCLTDKDSNRVRHGICYSFFQLRSLDSIRSAPSTEGEALVPEDDSSAQQPETQDNSLLAAPSYHRGRKRYQLVSMCLISHHPFFSTFRDVLIAVKKLIDRYEERIQRLIRSHHLKRRSIWDLLLSPTPLSASLEQLIGQDLREIDTYILRLLSSPVPVPGKTRTELYFGPASFYSPLSFALPDRTRFSLVDFPLHLLLELLNVDTCLKVLTAIMLEHKVLILSHDYNALTMSILGFIAMLYPLEYMFPVIPLLPSCMCSTEQLLMVPTPFLIGAPANFFTYKRDCQLPDDVWLFNIDTGEVRPPPRAEKLPSLPEPEGSILKTRFSQALASMSIASVPASAMPSATTVQPADPNAVDVAVRMAMVKFFLSENVLANWADHTRILRLHPRPVIGFQHNTFLKSRPNACAFTAQLVKTQAVEAFCEWALCPDNDAWQRVAAGLADPTAVGDKACWFAADYLPVQFNLLDPQSALYRRLAIATGDGAKSLSLDAPTDDSMSGEESDGGTSPMSMASLEESIHDMVIATPRPLPVVRLAVDESEVYAPPSELQLPEASRPNSSALGDTTDSDGTSTVSDSPNQSRKSSMAPRDDDDEALEPIVVPPYPGANQSLAERRGNPLPPPVSTSAKAAVVGRAGSDLDRTPQPDGDQYQPAKFSPIANDPIGMLQTPVSSASTATAKPDKIRRKSSSSGSDSDQGVDMTAKDMVAAVRSDMTDIASAAKARAKSATSKLAGLFDEVKAKHKDGQQQQRRKQQQSDEKDSPKLRSLSNQQQAARHPSAGTPSSTSSGFGGSIASRPSISQTPAGPSAPPFKKGYEQATTDLAARQQNIDQRNAQHSENQQFLSDIVQFAFEGQTIGWMKLNRLKKLLEDEAYRLCLLTKLNTQLSRKYKDDDAHIEDLLLGRKQFKTFITVMRAAVAGIESSYSNGTSGGMASAFLLLEVSHTHYWQPELGLKDPDALPAPRPPPQLQQQPPNRSASPAVQRHNMEQQSQRPHDLPIVSVNRPEDTQSPGSSSSPEVTAPVTTNRPHGLLKSALLHRGDSSDSLSSGASAPVATGPPSGEEVLPKTVLSAGYRYRNGQLLAVRRVSPTREYLFQHLVGKDRSWLWDQMNFWEQAFIDAVAHERDLAGYDMNPQEVILRYGSLADPERRRLELDEDRLLSVMLFNSAAYMLMVACNRNEVRRKVRRLLGKSHLGLIASQSLNQALDALNWLAGNDIDLRVPISRLVRRYTFPAHLGTDNSGEMLFVEVCSDSLLLRSVSGVQRDRWWFDMLINMTYSPRTRVICLWMKNQSDQVELHQFYTRKCRDLYNRIKAAMEQTASQNRLARPGPNLCAEFPVTQVDGGAQAVVQVTPEGVYISRPDSSKFIDLCHIKRCYAQHGNVFILELFDQDSGAIRQVKMMSDKADQICYNVLCVISMVASASSNSSTPMTGMPPGSDFMAAGMNDPLAVPGALDRRHNLSTSSQHSVDSTGGVALRLQYDSLQKR